MAWAGLSEAALRCLVTCLPPSLTKLNVSGCRTRLTDDGQCACAGDARHGSLLIVIE